MSQISAIRHFSSLDELTSSQQDEVLRIFFESSSVQNFASSEDASAFFRKWTEYYFDAQYPGDNFAYFGLNEEVLGYLSGTTDSQRAQAYFDNINVCYSVFADLFERFPAHFHINVAEKARGNKIGSMLVQRFVEHLKHQGIRGVHLVTSPDAQNVSFYRRNLFNDTVERTCKQRPILFMGRSL